MRIIGVKVFLLTKRIILENNNGGQCPPYITGPHGAAARSLAKPHAAREIVEGCFGLVA
jgi:hypothetical protein